MAEAKKCSIVNCKRPYRSKGYCDVHFKKWRAGEVEGHKTRYKTCKEENCKKPIFKRGMCEQHFGAWSASKKGVPATTEAPAVATATPTPTAESPKTPETAPSV